jgi:hypothetical protein
MCLTIVPSIGEPKKIEGSPSSSGVLLSGRGMARNTKEQGVASCDDDDASRVDWIRNPRCAARQECCAQPPKRRCVFSVPVDMPHNEDPALLSPIADGQAPVGSGPEKTKMTNLLHHRINVALFHSH